MVLLEILRTTNEELIYGNRITTITALLVMLFMGGLAFQRLRRYIDKRIHPEKPESQVYFDAEMALETAKAIPAAGIVADAFGTIVYVNKQLTELLHWREDEMIGKNLDMIVPAKSRQMHNTALKRWRETGEKGKVFDHPMQLQCLTKGDIEIPVEITIKEMIVHEKPFVVGKIRDMRHQLEQIENIKRDCSRENEILRKEVDMYREIERESGGGMMKWLYSKDRVVMSLGMQALFGMNQPECYTADTTNRLIPDDRIPVGQTVIGAIEAGAKNYHITFHLINGKTICLSAGIKRNKDGLPLIVYGVMHEIKK